MDSRILIQLKIFSVEFRKPKSLQWWWILTHDDTVSYGLRSPIIGSLSYWSKALDELTTPFEISIYNIPNTLLHQQAMLWQCGMFFLFFFNDRPVRTQYNVPPSTSCRVSQAPRWFPNGDMNPKIKLSNYGQTIAINMLIDKTYHRLQPYNSMDDHKSNTKSTRNWPDRHLA